MKTPPHQGVLNVLIELSSRFRMQVDVVLDEQGGINNTRGLLNGCSRLWTEIRLWCHLRKKNNSRLTINSFFFQCVCFFHV